jgi:ABC-type oligopeptide transport system substrate-binding subunit
MRRGISRRGVIGAPILLAGCRKRFEYFGNYAVPGRRVLKFALGLEPDGLDPAGYNAGFEFYILPSLFEGLISYDPYTVEPAAGLATHFEVNRDDTQFTFFLRGHPNPRGTRLPIPMQSAPAGATLSGCKPAMWTDGAIITAHDFVYSWRRVIDPATAAPSAYILSDVRNAHDIQRGVKKVEDFGVRAVDDFTFQIELERPAPLFLKLTGNMALAAVPGQAIRVAKQRGAEEKWIEPENIVSSGAFRLKEWRPHERVVLQRNPGYYDAHLVQLDEVEFLSVERPGTIVDLYQSGEVHTMPGERIPIQFAPVLEGKRDFHVAPAFFGVWALMNTRRPPFDDPVLRYSVNMAVDKQRMANVLGAGRVAARGFVPPMPGYPNPQVAPVEVGGRSYNVLEHNPDAARALLRASRHGSSRRLKLRYLMNASLPLSSTIALVLRQQLGEVLGAELSIDVQENKVWEQSLLDLTYEGLSDGGDWGTYVDPSFFLGKYVIGSSNNSTGWEDPVYDTMLAAATSMLDPAARLRQLAECERYVLCRMPTVPLCYNTWSCLQKPFVRGMPFNLLDLRFFKYVSIDPHWRAS